MSTSTNRTLSACILLFGLGLSVVPTVVAQDVAQPAVSPAIEEGRNIALNRAKGNCAVCHQIPGVEFHGDIAPPLIAMKQRFPDREKLHAQIYDATQFNLNSFMPPFGRHNILTPEELDKVVDWVLTL
jgi:L-cysteine S-thiosulfotransferase